MQLGTFAIIHWKTNRCVSIRLRYSAGMEQSEAILIGRSRYSETSLIVHWCAPEAGLFRTLAKGALRPKSTFGNRLDLFVSADIQWHRSRRSDLHTLGELKWKDPRLGIRESYGRVLAATYLVKVVTWVAEPGTPIPGLYGVLAKAMDHLQANDPTEKLVRRFEWRLAQDQGVAGASEDDAAVVLEEALHRRLPLQRQQVMDWIRSQPEGC